jgi:VWFA-related protein
MKRVAALLAVSIGIPVLAQQPPTSPTPASPTPVAQPQVFRAGTDLVEVDVVVHDKNGAFVSDLSPDDFQLQEAGKPQDVQQFYLHVTTASGWADRLPGTGASASAPAQSSGRRVFIVVFDDAHLTPGGFKRTQAAAVNLFTQQFHAGDVGGVVANGRVANNRLTTDREEILKAVRAAKPNSKLNSKLADEREWPRMSEIEAVRVAVNNDDTVRREVMTRACSDDPDQCRVVDPESAVRGKAFRLAGDARVEADLTLQLLKTVLANLQNLEGRKTVLLLSEGFIAEESWPVVQDTVGMAARTNARIYTLDARGLDRGVRTVFDVAPGGDDAGSRLLAQMDFGADSINSLAADTGGFVIRNTNLFDRAIAQIVDDASNYYVLGYRPSTPQDGTFHKIVVKVKRPGLSLRARRGYVAIPRPAATPTLTASAHSAAGSAAHTETSPAASAAANRPDAGGPIPLRPEPSPATTAAAPAAAPEPAPVEASVIRHSETASGFRVRPDARAHTEALESAAAPDADAKAGWDAYQRGDVEAARPRLAAAAARPAAQIWVHYALGQANYALRRYPEAVAAWEKVQTGAPDFEPVIFDLVDGYIQLKEHDQAIRLLRGAEQRWPHDPEVFNALGVVQTVRGSLDDAIKSFQGAIGASATEPTSYFNLAKALELRYSRSRRYVQQVRTWVANEGDRTAAIENYQKYLGFGGPYAEAAREGLTRLKWVPSAKN